MLDNLDTTPSEDTSQSGTNIGAADMRNRMQNLTLNEQHSDLSLSSKEWVLAKKQRPTQNQLKKRRFREMDRPWDLNLEEGSNSVMIATP